MCSAVGCKAVNRALSVELDLLVVTLKAFEEELVATKCRNVLFLASDGLAGLLKLLLQGQGPLSIIVIGVWQACLYFAGMVRLKKERERCFTITNT